MKSGTKKKRAWCGSKWHTIHPPYVRGYFFCKTIFLIFSYRFVIHVNNSWSLRSPHRQWSHDTGGPGSYATWEFVPNSCITCPALIKHAYLPCEGAWVIWHFERVVILVSWLSCIIKNSAQTDKRVVSLCSSIVFALFFTSYLVQCGCTDNAFLLRALLFWHASHSCNRGPPKCKVGGSENSLLCMGLWLNFGLYSALALFIDIQSA